MKTSFLSIGLLWTTGALTTGTPYIAKESRDAIESEIKKKLPVAAKNEKLTIREKRDLDKRKSRV